MLIGRGKAECESESGCEVGLVGIGVGTPRPAIRIGLQPIDMTLVGNIADLHSSAAVPPSTSCLTDLFRPHCQLLNCRHHEIPIEQTTVFEND